MYSSLIGKVEKAKRYAAERDRVAFLHFTATFRGDHDRYQVSYGEGKWACTCAFFSRYAVCSHTMALQRMLDGMVTVPQAQLAATE